MSPQNNWFHGILLISRFVQGYAFIFLHAHNLKFKYFPRPDSVWVEDRMYGALFIVKVQ